MFLTLLMSTILGASQATPLPAHDGQIKIPAQPYAEDARTVTAHLRYPGGALENVKPSTGILLSLHNWGGTEFRGAPDPAALTGKLDCIVVGVDYFQSGSEHSELPYDFGWLQALDVLRVLQHVMASLQERNIPFAEDRLYATGGSGGGNVSLMANKLAPRTFAAVVDISGMKELSDDVAFNQPGGSSLNARYAPGQLTDDMQEIRHLGNREHLQTMKTLGNGAKIISVHGKDDASCLFSEALSHAEAMKESGLDFEFFPITAAEVDGDLFKDAGHRLGDRTAILLHVAGDYLRPDGDKSIRRRGATDFERKEIIRYQTGGGTWVVDYSQGFPVGHFDPSREP